MGLFGGKKQNADANNASAPNDSGKKKVVKTELMSAIQESVVGVAVESMKQNTRFIDHVNGEEVYALLMFDTNDIGGIVGKEAKKDESKGSILHYLQTGQIANFARGVLLEQGLIAIIPDPNTIENMREYDYLNNIKYALCYCTQNGDVEFYSGYGTDGPDGDEKHVTLNEVREYIASENTFDTFLGRNGVGVDGMFSAGNASAGDDEIPMLDEDPADGDNDGNIMPPPMMSAQPAAQPVSGSDEELLSDDEELLPDDDTTPPNMYQNMYNTAPQPMATSDLDGTVRRAQEEAAQAMQDAERARIEAEDLRRQADIAKREADEAKARLAELEANQGVNPYVDDNGNVTKATVEEYIDAHVYRMYSDDLDLEVSTKPFDSVFMHDNNFVPFSENRGEGWLNEYLSQMSKDANVSIERMHHENLMTLRRQYMEIIETQCQAIVELLDTNSKDTRYGKLRASFMALRDENMRQVPESVRVKREQLEAAWEKRLKEVGDAAAHNARQTYMDRYRDAQEDRIAQLESDEKSEIQRDFENSLKLLNDDRRKEAAKLLDLAIHDTLEKMSERYNAMMEEENKEYDRVQAELLKFIDENRKDEKARIEALEAQIRENHAIDDARNDATTRIQAMTSEFEARSKALASEVEQVRRDCDMKVKDLESEWMAKIAAEKNNTSEAQARYDELFRKYTELDATKTAEYRDKIEALKQDRKDVESQIEHIVETHKKSNKLSIYLLVAISIAAIGVGFILGSVISVRNQSRYEQQSLYMQQQYMHNMDNGSIGVPGVTVDGQ